MTVAVSSFAHATRCVPTAMRTLVILAALHISACASSRPDLDRLYSMQAGNPNQPPVIIIHGALGSRLSDTKTGQEIWPGPFTRLLFSNYRTLAFEINPQTLTPAAPRLTPSGIADSAGGRDFYGRILAVLSTAGGYKPGTLGEPATLGEKRYYVFYYDWRQDNVTSVRELNQFIERIREDYGDPALKLDIVAHSMGGMITRYFARYGTADVLNSNEFPVTQAGAEKIRRAVLLGTPNLGSLDAIRTLIRGFPLAGNSIPAEVVATFPSTYQVLPHAINDWFVTMEGKPLHRDLFDVKFWRRFEFSVFDPAVRARIRAKFDDPAAADDYLALLERYFEKHIERARRFSWSLTVPFDQPKLAYIVFGGDCFPTAAKVVVEDVDDDFALRLTPKEIARPRPGIDYEQLMLAPGDGTVTKASLLARQTFDPSVERHRYSFFPLDYSLFLCESHSQLTGNIDFQNNLLHALLSVDN